MCKDPHPEVHSYVKGRLEEDPRYHEYYHICQRRGTPFYGPEPIKAVAKGLGQHNTT